MSCKVLSLLSSILLILVGCNQSYKKDYEELKWEYQKLKKETRTVETSETKSQNKIQILCDSNKILLDSISKLNWQYWSCMHDSETAKPSYWFSEYEIKEFQEMGFKNPQKEILETLYNNKTLFAEDGILGGTMTINSAMLIGSKWAIAEGEDGHTGFYYLLEYTVQKNKSIKWKVLNKKNLYD